MADELPPQREAFLRETFERWNAGEREGFAGSVTDDLVLESALTGRTFHGPDGLAEWMGEIDANFGAWRIRIDEIRSAGQDRFLLLGVVHLRGRGSGVEFDQPIGWIIEFEGERAKRLATFSNHDDAIEAAAGR